MIWWTEKHRGESTFLGWVIWRWDRIVLRYYAWGVRKNILKPTFTKSDLARTKNIVNGPRSWGR